MKRICKLCGKEFEPIKNSRRLVCYDKHYNTCEFYGKRFEITNYNYPERTCSPECRGKLRTQHAQATSLKKYGVKNAGYTKESQEKIKATYLKKYGADHFFASEEGKAKVKKGMIEKYGVDNPMKSQIFRNKSEQTCQHRYGDKHVLGSKSSLKPMMDARKLELYGTVDPGNLPEFREKARQTCVSNYGKPYYMQTDEGKANFAKSCSEKYGVEHPMYSEEVKARMRKNSLQKYGVEYPVQSDVVKSHVTANCMNNHGVPWPCMLPQVKANNHSLHSKVNDQFSQALSDAGLAHQREFRIADKLYDFRLTDSNIVIEIDPTATHTTSDSGFFSPVSKDYQYNKTSIAASAGYRCIHIFDWDNWDVIINTLKTDKQTIYARKTDVNVINRKECIDFLNKYHFQHSCNNQSKRYGLFYEGTLVEVMTFGSPRYNSNYQYELLRLCSHPQFNIVGGASKLLHAFIKDWSPESIISYCDNSKFTGDTYFKLGFDLLSKGQPGRIWSKGSRCITDNLLRQRGYDQLFGTNYGKGTSNEQLMIEHNWLPIYNCGQSTYVWRRKLNHEESL